MIKTGSLVCIGKKPVWLNKGARCDWFGAFGCYIWDDKLPEVTFENSPQEVELKLCHQTETIKIADCNPKAQPCVLTNHGIDTNVVKFD